MADCKMKICVTGGAGFIGSNLVDSLLEQGANVVVLDNFSTGKRENLTQCSGNPDFTLMEGDIRDFETCKKAVSGCDYVFHEAALGSVPRSVANPQASFEVNVQGFCNMIEAARLAGVKRFIYQYLYGFLRLGRRPQRSGNHEAGGTPPLHRLVRRQPRGLQHEGQEYPSPL